MSVYIKGMEMPTSCWECHFGHGDTGVCVVDFKNHGDWDAPHDCPLGTVPPHGRLIDADALIVDLMDRGIEGVQMDDWHEIQQAVADAPTIIPAEEGE